MDGYPPAFASLPTIDISHARCHELSIWRQIISLSLLSPAAEHHVRPIPPLFNTPHWRPRRLPPRQPPLSQPQHTRKSPRYTRALQPSGGRPNGCKRRAHSFHTVRLVSLYFVSPA